ncbi:MAG TPA: PorP/SprF family type IX secretion system membrane protein [Chitinophagaceae bacterium]|jgi:type IX secretion system PorP/SprF family membrane protein
MKTLKHFVAIASCCWSLTISAQDLHFSQFMNSPLLTNPANTGFIPEADYRLGMNYRNQWSDIMSVPYKTMSAFGDVQVFRNKIETGWMGLGGVILHDVAGSGNLTSTKVYGSVAYHQMINSGSLLSLGFNIGWANKQINVTNLKFPDQYDGKFFDSHLPTGVALDANNINYLDLQAGLNYAYFPNNNVYVNAGFSAMHVNRPHESFFDQTTTADNRVPVRYTGFLNGSFKVDDQWIINPNIYYSEQAKASEIVGGLNVHYNLTGDGEDELIAGLYYRLKDAFIPMIGLVYKEYTFTFTYDATISTLANYDNTRGAFEFSLIKNGFFTSGHTDRQSLCPQFKNNY